MRKIGSMKFLAESFTLRVVRLLFFPTFLSLVLTQCAKEDTNEVTPTPPEEEVPSKYELVWSDEFNGDSLNESNWNYESGTGVNGDWGTGQLDRATDRPENVQIVEGVENADGGCLNITTRKENYGGRQYTSGRVNTEGNRNWGPGHRIAARVWPRDVRYKGQGFAFWMMPAEIPEGESYIMWPQGGEVDIMEYIGAIPYHNLGTVHYAWAWEDNQYRDWNHGHLGGYYKYEIEEVPVKNPDYGNYPPGEGDPEAGSEGFHVYSIDWYEDRMEFAVDDVVYHIHHFNDGSIGEEDGEDEAYRKTVDDRRIYLSEYSNHFEEWKPFEHKFYLVLSAGVGGDDNRTYGGAIVQEAEFPCSVFVDWVRVYEIKEKE